jgi:hypothetical protein
MASITARSDTEAIKSFMIDAAFWEKDCQRSVNLLIEQFLSGYEWLSQRSISRIRTRLRLTKDGLRNRRALYRGGRWPTQIMQAALSI